MQRVLCRHLWRAIRAEAAKAEQREAAIAYVTRDHIGLKKGDMLVVDASEYAVRSGQTNAKLLVKLARRGVALFSCPGLHAKVLLLDDIAVVGSGNMSDSSHSALVEAAIMTDATTIVSGVASLIEQLKRQSVRLDKRSLRALATIKVVRSGFGSVGKFGMRKQVKISELGTRTWLIGVVEQDREPTKAEQLMIDRSRKALARQQKTDEDSITWIRWSGKGPIALTGKPGDQVIQIWRQSSEHKRPSSVLKPIPILLRKRLRGITFIFIRDSEDKEAQMGWGKFKKFLQRLGERRAIGPHSERILDSELADAISRNWDSTKSSTGKDKTHAATKHPDQHVG